MRALHVMLPFWVAYHFGMFGTGQLFQAAACSAAMEEPLHLGAVQMQAHLPFKLVSRAPHVQALSAGKVGEAAPMEAVVTEAVVRAAETREGAVVLLPDAIPCSVSFTRGAERSVLLGVHGLPQVMLHPASA